MIRAQVSARRERRQVVGIHAADPSTVLRGAGLVHRGKRDTIAPMVTPLSSDTDAAIEERQVRAWRDMTPAQKANLITRLSQTAREMAAAGVRDRHPDASPREQFLRLAMLTLGPELARRVYPEIEQLGLR